MIRNRIETIYPNNVLVVLTLLKSRMRKGYFTTVGWPKGAVAAESRDPQSLNKCCQQYGDRNLGGLKTSVDLDEPKPWA